MLSSEWFPLKEIIISKIDPKKVNQSIFFIGMPGIGLVGKLAVETMIKHYDATHLQDVIPKDLPPRVIINKDGIPSFMKVGIYHHYDELSKNHLFFIVGDIQPQSMEGQYTFGEYVAELAQKYHAKHLIACAASVTLYLQEDPKVHVSGSNKETIDFFTLNENVDLFHDGTITGANGLIPVIASQFYNIPSVILLADTTRLIEQIFTIDPKSSKAILQVLKERYNLTLEPDMLDEKIDELNTLLVTLKNQARDGVGERAERDGPDTFIS